VSLGYYPTKDMVDGRGLQFKPGAFVRAYLTWDLWEERFYLFGDVTFQAARSFTPRMLLFDCGAAARPFPAAPRLEFRLGAEGAYDLHPNDLEIGLYLGVRLVF
jgi:hypothetical protein